MIADYTDAATRQHRYETLHVYGEREPAGKSLFGPGTSPATRNLACAEDNLAWHRRHLPGEIAALEANVTRVTIARVKARLKSIARLEGEVAAYRDFVATQARQVAA